VEPAKVFYYLVTEWKGGNFALQTCLLTTWWVTHAEDNNSLITELLLGQTRSPTAGAKRTKKQEIW
jgi:hypothetical protein